MSGGLTRLVLRAQGQLPVAQPLLPSRFAPAATAAPIESDTAASWGETHEDSQSPSKDFVPVRAAPPPIVSQPSASSSASRNDPVPITTSSPVPFLAAPPPSPVAAPQASSPPDITAPRATPTPRAPSLSLGPTTPTAVPPARSESPAATVTSTPLPHREPPPTAPRFAPTPPVASPPPPFTPPAIARAPAATHAPDIHISIGRLEVVAAPARTTTPVRAAPARRPSLSLADYLAQRK
jgi:hypothetical protein